MTSRDATVDRLSPVDQALDRLKKRPHDPRLALPAFEEGWNAALFEVSKALRSAIPRGTGWIDNHEWPKLTADVTDMQAVRVKRDDGKGYIWKWLDSLPSGTVVSDQRDDKPEGAAPRTDALPNDSSRIPPSRRTDSLGTAHHVGPAIERDALLTQVDFLLDEKRQLERELADAEWKAMHRLEMFNQREQLIRDLQTAAMRSPVSATASRTVPSETWEESNRCYLQQFDRAESLQRDLNAKQAELDRVMLEHCPDEMTAEQKANWAKHQRAARPEAAPTPQKDRP